MRTEKPKSNSFIIRYSVCLFSSGWTLSSFCNRGGSRGRVQGVHTPPPPLDDLRFSNTTGSLCTDVSSSLRKKSGEGTTGILPKKKKTMWFIGVEVEQETIAPPPKKNPGSAPV